MLCRMLLQLLQLLLPLVLLRIPHPALHRLQGCNSLGCHVEPAGGGGGGGPGSPGRLTLGFSRPAAVT